MSLCVVYILLRVVFVVAQLFCGAHCALLVDCVVLCVALWVPFAMYCVWFAVCRVSVVAMCCSIACVCD